MTALLDNQAAPAVAPSRILVIGAEARALAAALVRMKGNVTVSHAETAQEATQALSQHAFDHVLVDNREDGTLTLMIPQIARLDWVRNIVVLAGPQSAADISAIQKVGAVFQPPYDAAQIADSLDIAIVEQRRNPAAAGEAAGRRASDAAQESNTDAGELNTEATPDGEATVDHRDDHPFADAEPTLAERIIGLAVHLPGVTPVLSWLYKHLALTILGSLFLAFVSYGVMIVFFLTSSGWSTPIQLGHGHELVMKAERDLNEMKVKRNVINQQLSDAVHTATEARQSIARSQSLAVLVSGTIAQEIQNRKRFKNELETQLPALRGVLENFGSSKQRQSEQARLKRDYDRRVISKTAFETGLLNLAQMERQIQSLKTEIVDKQSEYDRISQTVDFLASLRLQLGSDEPVAIASGVTELVPLSNQVIEVRQVLSRAKADLATAEDQRGPLQDSLKVLNESISSLEGTPLIKAVKEPVTVLFVPYDNLNSFVEGKPLYSCAAMVFWCRRIGTIGASVPGEISTTHPFFGKPMRGQFIEANLTDEKAALKEILHASRPLFF
ncbi:MAG: hypothetical protein R3D34_10110 [Nitratireductor sp.]